MPTSCSCIKCLKSICELLYLVVEIPQARSIKEVIWKTSQNLKINTRSSHPELFCQKMFLKILQNSQINISARVWKVAGWKPETVRISHWRCFVKNVVLKKAHWCFRNQPLIDPLQNRGSWIHVFFYKETIFFAWVSIFLT